MKTTKQKLINIVVDDREQRSGMVEILEATESVSVSISRLACGDYEVGDKLLFERKTQLHILQGIPGVGPERACTLLDKFGSVEAVLTASMEELLAIKGIGKQSVDAIHWAVHEPEIEYDRSCEDFDPVV
ncbi:MAG: helix-hairpin-helix domain-containing protein [Mariprofundus sp.]|nr:helix-hairpin-helix domain-containing protein [Mariprofundus sp.]